MKNRAPHSFRRFLGYESLEKRWLLSITVNTLVDEADGSIVDGDVSLRDALATAPAGETIDFAATLDGGTILLTLGELAVTRSLTIDAAMLPSGLTIDASGNDPTPTMNNGDGSRVMTIDDGGRFTDSHVAIRGLTLTGGDSIESGGAILSLETLTVMGSRISCNSAQGSGGGIAVENPLVFRGGHVTVIGSTISGNIAAFAGGGIAAGDVSVMNSTISGNSAGTDGGGIATRAASVVTGSSVWGNSARYDGGGIKALEHLTVTKSTISENSAGGRGGGIRIHRPAIIQEATISRNYATVGGGVWVDSHPVEILGSIVAGNVASGASQELGSGGGGVTAHYSLIGDGLIDPMLGPLADNGGPTRTHALLPGSPAIDAGDPAFVPPAEYDQRGEPYRRVAGGRIDMGAHERQDLTVEILAVASPTVTAVTEVTIRFNREVTGLDLSDLMLVRNGVPDDLLTDAQTLASDDNRTFVLGGLGPITTASGYYTLSLAASGSGIVDTGGGPLDAGGAMSWAMGRAELRLTVDTLVDEQDRNLDDGDISLRDALAAAAEGETIEFDPSLDGETILLTLGELVVTRSLTIDASMLPSGITIDASGNDPTPDVNDGLGSRVLMIEDGNTAVDSVVTVRGLTLTGGDTSGDGGAVQTRESLGLSGSTISGNSALDDGGGIYGFGLVTIDSSTISYNSAADDGGGVRSLAAVNATSSTIKGNTAGDDGGGIRSSRSVVIHSSVVSENSAEEDGGGIFVSGTATVESSTISDNIARNGGGIHASLSVRVEMSTISRNSSRDIGGGIAVSSDNDVEGNVAVTRSTISGNSSGGSGGGILVRGRADVDSSVIVNNSASSGGGINGTNVTVDSSSISFNTARFGGGGIVAETVTVTKSTIEGNSADREGGGVSGHEVTLSASTVSGNSARDGGGISGGVTVVDLSTISGNSARLDGGGIMSHDTVSVTGSTLTGNSAVDDGGGIAAVFLSSSQVTIDNSIVAANSAGTGSDLNPASAGVSVRYSLIGTNSGTGLTEAPVGTPDDNGNVIGGPLTGVIDPLLGVLADNGGTTFTHALLSGSPAIDMGDPLAIPGSGGLSDFDQRGDPYTRRAGGRIDIGAYERQDLSVEIVDVVTPTVVPVAEVTIEFSSPVTGFDLGDLELSLNGRANLLDGRQTLATEDNRRFVLGGLAEVSAASGYYSLRLASSGSGVVDATGSPLEAGETTSWAMGRTELRLTVNTLVDESDGNLDDSDISLRDALAASAPGETIEFDPSLDGGTILLTLGELIVTRSRTIDASLLPSGITVDASGNDSTPDENDGRGSRVLTIDDGTGLDSPVTLRGLTLSGGDVSGDGGAILSRESLTIAESSISGNSATDDGGGIYGFISVTISYSSISGNSADDDGGAIRSFGDVNVDSAIISHNTAGDDGGGIRSFGDVIIGNSTISGNSAREHGGGVSAIGMAVIHSSTISGNSAFQGGGINGSSVMVTGSTISGNSASHGGGINGSSVMVTGSTISGNLAKSGGGIRSQTGLSVDSSTIFGNTARGHLDEDEELVGGFGGGIWALGSSAIGNSIVAGNTANGGGLDIGSDSGELMLHYSLIGHNSGTQLIEAPVGMPDENGNLIGGSIHGTIDPRLAPLDHYGGAMLTHRLLSTSPAMNSGDPAPVTPSRFDQRGSPFIRIAGDRIDMGAFEVQALGDMNFSGIADMDDIDALVTSFRDAAVYEALYGVPPATNGDTDGDGDFDFDDIPGFVELLNNPTSVSSGATLAEVAQDRPVPRGTISRRDNKAEEANEAVPRSTDGDAARHLADIVWSGELGWLGRKYRRIR